MKQPDYSHIEQNPDLHNRLKAAAKESILSFFPGRDPPEEALEYVVVAFCLGETAEEFNERLKQLFERDCQSVVEYLTSFVNSHPEFNVTITEDGHQSQKEEPKQVTHLQEKPKRLTRSSEKEQPKSQIQKIVWDASLDVAPSAAKKPMDKSEKEVGMDRWETVEHDVPNDIQQTTMATTAVAQRRVPRNRLFESALGSITDQVKRADPVVKSHIVSKIKPRKNEIIDIKRKDNVLIVETPNKERESILKRIRKPDGSQFEEWELRNEKFPQTRKRQAEGPESVKNNVKNAQELSEVEQLKRKIARLEQEVHSTQGSSRPTAPQDDVDRYSICVKNVHFLANEEVLAAHFHGCAPIINISFAKDIYGRPKGFCFIQFAYEDCVERALELDQSLLLGRNISIVRKLSRAPMPSPSQPQDWKALAGPARIPTHAASDPLSKERNGDHDNNDGDDGGSGGGEGELHENLNRDRPDIKDFAIDTGSQDMP